MRFLFHPVAFRKFQSSSTYSQLLPVLVDKNFHFLFVSIIPLSSQTSPKKNDSPSIDEFVEGRNVTLTLNWGHENFLPSQQRRNLKKAVQNLRIQLSSEIKEECTSVSNKNMESVVLQAIESQDFSMVENKLDWCLDVHKFPSFDILKALALFSVESKNSTCVSKIRHVMKAGHPTRYIENAKLLLYATEAFWKCGNIAESFKCLETLFNEFSFVKTEGRFLLSRMISEAVKFRSEATLNFILDYAKVCASRSNDYFALTVMWYYLFVSELFIDQQSALALLETHENLKIHISFLVEYICRLLLKSNRIEDTLRLLELLLKLKLYDKYSVVQRNLFNYYYSKDNIQGCSEILKTSISLDIPLSEDQRNKYSKLILNLDDDSFKKLVARKPLKLKF